MIGRSMVLIQKSHLSLKVMSVWSISPRRNVAEGEWLVFDVFAGVGRENLTCSARDRGYWCVCERCGKRVVDISVVWIYTKKLILSYKYVIVH